MSLSFFIGGKFPFSRRQPANIPQEWIALLTSLDSHALEKYLKVRLRHTGRNEIETITANSQSVDQQTMAELKEIFLSSVEDHKANPELVDPVGLHTAWVVDRTFNMTAMRCSEKYIIAINIATPILIYRLFRELVKLPGFFPDIDGEFVKETNEPLTIDSFDPSAIHEEMTMEEAMYWAMGFENGEHKMSMTQKRLGLADLLTFLSMDILISHELAHIVSGHCDYMSAVKLSMLQEITENANPEPGIDYTTRLIWEMEADITSVSILGAYDQFSPQQKKYGNYFNLLGIPGTTENLVGLYLLCAEIIFEMFGSIEQRATSVQAHPDPYIRTKTFYESICGLFDEENSPIDEFLKNCCEPFRRSLAAALHALPYKKHIDSADRKVRDAIQVKLLNYVLKEKHLWKSFSLREQIPG